MDEDRLVQAGRGSEQVVVGGELELHAAHAFGVGRLELGLDDLLPHALPGEAGLRVADAVDRSLTVTARL